MTITSINTTKPPAPNTPPTISLTDFLPASSGLTEFLLRRANLGGLSVVEASFDILSTTSRFDLYTVGKHAIRKNDITWQIMNLEKNCIHSSSVLFITKFKCYCTRAGGLYFPASTPKIHLFLHPYTNNLIYRQGLWERKFVTL